MGEAGGPLVPGYEMLGILGQGGFGVVYRARQLAVGREVALKVDNRVLVSDRDRRRFMREVTSAGALSGHPHVADVYDAGVLGDGRPYMVLELCPNGSLADRLRDGGPLDPREVRDIGVRIADALAAAHALGVLHRDVKPANILVNSYGMVALSDFGLATMPGAGGAVPGEVSVTRESLTPAYAPPEAFDLTEPTAAGDVYSLAATLYALLHGRPPRFPEHGVVNIAVVMALHRLPVPDIPGVPAALTAVLRHGMASDPAQRIRTAAELRDALAALAPDGSPGSPHSGNAHPGNGQNGSGHPGNAQTGNPYPGNVHPGSGHPGNAQTGIAQTGNSRIGSARPMDAHPGNAQTADPYPGNVHSGNTHPGNVQAGNRHPGDGHSAYGGPGHVAPPHALARTPTQPPGARPGTPPRPAPRGLRQAPTLPPRPAPGVSRQSMVFAMVAAVFALLLAAGLVVLLLEGGQDPGTSSRLGGAPARSVPAAQ
ncbi:protein kinase domain-containing protein [Microbispora triticiradicis]|uniref:serine/threonine-protein kinase n=1 Tax=Microbispora triticiradicis TaxID=2200763 RepID=UPI001AD81FA8|nr:protein kinase [Microbispora triticiradicis]